MGTALPPRRSTVTANTAATIHSLSWPTAVLASWATAAARRRGDRDGSPALLLVLGPVTRDLREAYVHGPPTEKKYRHREHCRHHPHPPVAHGSPSFGGHRRRATRPGRAAGPPLAAERY